MIDPAECVIETTEGVQSWTPTPEEIKESVSSQAAVKPDRSDSFKIVEITHRTQAQALVDECHQVTTYHA